MRTRRAAKPRWLALPDGKTISSVDDGQLPTGDDLASLIPSDPRLLAPVHPIVRCCGNA